MLFFIYIHLRAGDGGCGSASSLSGGGGASGGGVAVEALSSVCDGSAFLQKTCKRGEPEMRPATGCVLLARTPGMAAREEQFFVNILGKVRVMPMAALELQCDVRPTAAAVELHWRDGLAAGGTLPRRQHQYPPVEPMCACGMLGKLEHHYTIPCSPCATRVFAGATGAGNLVWSRRRAHRDAASYGPVIKALHDFT
jgi:hypothetical protein